MTEGHDIDGRQSLLSALDWHFIEPMEAAEDEAVVTSHVAVESTLIVSDHFERIAAPGRAPASGADALPTLQLISRGPLDPFLYLREFSAPQAADWSSAPSAGGPPEGEAEGPEAANARRSLRASLKQSAKDFMSYLKRGDGLRA